MFIESETFSTLSAQQTGGHRNALLSPSHDIYPHVCHVSVYNRRTLHSNVSETSPEFI